MNSVIGVSSLHGNIQPPGNPDQLPAVVVRPHLPSAEPSKPTGHSPRQTLKRLMPDSYEPVCCDVPDVQTFCSVLEFPLGYLRGVLLAAYRWAEKFLSPSESPEPTIDLYV
jgi:hypothetical protein